MPASTRFRFTPGESYVISVFSVVNDFGFLTTEGTEYTEKRSNPI